MNVRLAGEKDIPELIDILKQVNLIHRNLRPDLFVKGTKYGEEDLVDILKNPETYVFVADNGSGIDGYIFCYLENYENVRGRTPIKTMYIDDLCVRESARGQKIGQILYSHAKEDAKALGCHNVTLHVWEGNETAEKFYRRQGMKNQFISLEEVLD